MARAHLQSVPRCDGGHSCWWWDLYELWQGLLEESVICFRCVCMCLDVSTRGLFLPKTVTNKGHFVKALALYICKCSAQASCDALKSGRALVWRAQDTGSTPSHGIQCSCESVSQCHWHFVVILLSLLGYTYTCDKLYPSSSWPVELHACRQMFR